MEYCLFDTKVTWLLWKHLNEECSESSLNYYRTVELPYSEIIMEMEKTGFVVDIDQAHLFANELTAEADAILADILAKYPKFPTTKEYKTEHPEMELLHTKEREDGKEGLVYVYRVYEDFNPNSTQHKIWALMQEGWKPEKVNKKSGQPTCDKHTLAGIAHKFPIAKQFTKYNRIQKVLGSFVKPFVEKCDDDHILRGSFNQCGTVTGRLSSSDPNLQNIPAHGEDGARMRSLIIAPNGYKVVGGDLSNIEARILAYYLEIVCKDSIMANAFRKGLDLHWENAKAWGLAVDPTLEDGKKDPGRNYAKTVLYLSMYGGGIAKLAQTLDISEKEAQKIMNTFEKNCPALNQLKTLVWNRMKRAGHITTLLGRPLSYPDINSSVKWKAEAAQRQTFNALIQGTAADLIKDLSVKTRATAARHNAMFVASVHDEQIFYCPEETAFAFAAEVTAIWSVQTYLKDIEVTAEFEVGDTWNQVK